jgi:hypothetical protein
MVVKSMTSLHLGLTHSSRKGERQCPETGQSGAVFRTKIVLLDYHLFLCRKIKSYIGFGVDAGEAST